ncbi:MAG: hypothetical protein R3318_01425 [Gammaproteobacteria bacterium]|nr:hypothetical protein [Gammaproteobacteria bacterium]
MADVYFGEFRLYVMEHRKAVEALVQESHTVPWFLLRYLKRIEKQANEPGGKTRMEGHMRGLIRFYVDNIDEHSELGERCQLIYAEYRRTLKMHQEKSE